MAVPPADEYRQEVVRLRTLLGAASKAAMDHITFTPFVPSAKVDEAVPVVLFQSGHSSSSKSHAPLLQAMADMGYVIVVLDCAGDLRGSKESIPKALSEFAEGKPTSNYNTMSTSGEYLAAALDWVKAQDRATIKGQAVDVSKGVASAGFC